MAVLLIALPLSVVAVLGVVCMVVLYEMFLGHPAEEDSVNTLATIAARRDSDCIRTNHATLEAPERLRKTDTIESF